MKKHNTLFVVTITILVLALLTWLVPITYYSEGYITESRIPIGIGNLFSYPLYTFYNFIYIFIYILLVGGLFGLLKRIPAYRVILDNLVSKIKNHEKLFFILTICLTALIVSFTGFTYELFFIIPFLAAVIYLLGYDNITTALVSVGSIVSGIIGNTFSNIVVGKIISFTNLPYTNLIIAKVVLLVISSALVILITLMHNKKIKSEKVKVEENIFVPKKVKADGVKTWPLKLILWISFIILVVSTINWSAAFKINFFDNLVKDMEEVLLFNKYILLIVFGLCLVVYLLKYVLGRRRGGEKNFIKALTKKGFVFFVISAVIVLLVLLKVFFEDIFGVTKIFTKAYEFLAFDKITLSTLFAGLPAFGTWNYNQYMAYVLIVQLAIAIACKVKPSEVAEGNLEGMKDNFYPATVCLIAYTALILLSNHPIVMTGLKYLLKTGSDGKMLYNNFTYPFVTFVSGVMNSDFSFYEYGVFTLSDTVNLFKESAYGVMGLVTQSMYGVAMLVAPTSVAVLYSLSSLNISYKEWWKNVWKLFLALFAITLITSMLVYLLF